jgi:hypothetical protein
MDLWVTKRSANAIEFRAYDMCTALAMVGFVIVAGGFVGCTDVQDLPPPPESLEQPKLFFGQLSAGGEGATLRYESFAVPGAIVHESISSRLSAYGVPPMRIEVRAKGRWHGSLEQPRLKIEEMKITPEGAPVGDDFKAQLEKGAPPKNLPLAILSLLDTPAADLTSPIRQPIMQGAQTENLVMEGVWACTREDGNHQSGPPARKLLCTLQEGMAVQGASSEERIKHRQARLLGALSAVRSGNTKNGVVSVEEVRLHLLAWSQDPRSTQIELHYHRQGCLNEDYCPILR